MNIIDLHTHTIASGHAYSTIEENVKGAIKSGIQILGMSDHAQSMPDAPHIFHLLNMKVIPPIIEGVRVLKGVEANIIDFNGAIDITEAHCKKLDYLIASLHPPVITPGHRDENTRAIIGAIQNPYITIIGHLDDGRYEMDYEAIVLAAKANNTLLEINNSSLKPTGTRENAKENSITLLKLCKKHGTAIVLGSDAHISYSIGDFKLAEELIETVNFPKALIANNDKETLKRYLRKDLEI